MLTTFCSDGAVVFAATGPVGPEPQAAVAVKMNGNVYERCTTIV
jgi:hypothetical protein